MREVYVVLASTGEYSDRTEWPIRVVQTEDRAKELVSELDAEFKTLWSQICTAKGVFDWDKYEVRTHLFKERWSKLEPSLGEPDYTGFYFFYNPVKIEE